MKEILHVIQREYLTRVGKKSFILGAILTPVLFISIIIFPTIWTNQNTNKSTANKIAVYDPQGIAKNILKPYTLTYINEQEFVNARSLVADKQFDEIIAIRYDTVQNSISIKDYYSTVSSDLVNNMKTGLERIIVGNELVPYKIKDIELLLAGADKKIEIEPIPIENNTYQVNKDNRINRALCYVFALTIYVLIFLFSSQVMQGVLEEKTNRIVELIITSISPVKFMVGKIIGIALLGFTQIAIWFLINYLFIILISIGTSSIQMNQFVSGSINEAAVSHIMNSISQINIEYLLLIFVIYFIMGYFLYSSLFAALGSFGSSTEELQQFSLLITSPLTLSILVLTSTTSDPNGPVSYFLSMLPFTAPIIMPVRIVYGAPFYEVAISLLILLITIVAIMYISGKIYRMAILYTGKKVTFRDIKYWLINK